MEWEEPIGFTEVFMYGVRKGVYTKPYSKRIFGGDKTTSIQNAIFRQQS